MYRANPRSFPVKHLHSFGFGSGFACLRLKLSCIPFLTLPKDPFYAHSRSLSLSLPHPIVALFGFVTRLPSGFHVLSYIEMLGFEPTLDMARSA